MNKEYTTTVAIGVRIPLESAEDFDQVVKELRINKTEFVRIAIAYAKQNLKLIDRFISEEN